MDLVPLAVSLLPQPTPFSVVRPRTHQDLRLLLNKDFVGLTKRDLPNTHTRDTNIYGPSTTTAPPRLPHRRETTSRGWARQSSLSTQLRPGYVVLRVAPVVDTSDRINRRRSLRVRGIPPPEPEIFPDPTRRSLPT